MKISRLLAYISYLAVGLIFILNALVETMLINFYARIFEQSLPGRPLPDITLLVLAGARDHVLWIIGVVGGIGFPLLLFYLDRSVESRRSFVPACLAFPIILGWLQALICFTAMAMVYVRL